MRDDGQHSACVEAWLARSAKGLPAESLLRLLDAALGVLWARTRTTLGEVTLTAISERVLYNAAERFPSFAALKVDPERGILCQKLGEGIGSVRAAELQEGARFVLTEFLTVIGSLTAQILTPELHAALLRVVPSKALLAKKGAKQPRGHSTKSEGTEPDP